MVKNIPTEKQAESELKPYYDEINQCIKDGINDYLTYDSHRAVIQTNRTKANLIRDYIVNHAKVTFQNRDNVRLHEKGGLFVVLINDKFAIRFKKLNKDKLSSNVPTGQSLKFSHQYAISFPDFEIKTVNLDAGYVSDTNYTFIDGIKNAFLVCRNGGNIHWSLELSSAESTITIPIEFGETVTEEQTTIIKVKEVARKKAQNDQ